MEKGEVDVLFIHHLPVIGGATHSMMLIIQAATERGLKCKVLFLQKNGSALSFYEREGVDFDTTDDVATYAHAYASYRSFISRRPWYPITRLIDTFNSTPRAKAHLKRYSPKLVYLNTSVLIPFAIAAKELDIPSIWHIREPLHSGNFGIRKRIIQNCFKKYPSKIISNSKMNAALLGIKPIEVIYNSVNFDQFDPSNDYSYFYKELGIDSNEKVISFLGGKVLTKGADKFIEAGIKVLKAGFHCYFVIAGSFNLSPTDGPMNKMEQKAANLLEKNQKHRKYFIFTGPLINVAPLLAVSDALVWASTSPHFSRPIMESMVMGKPVVASKDLSSSEIITNREEGILVEVNKDSFAKGIQQILSNPEKAKKMGKSGRKKGLQLFDSKKNNEKIVDEIIRLING